MDPFRRLRPFLYKKPKKVKLYPVIPRGKRSKRSRAPEKPSLTSHPIEVIYARHSRAVDKNSGSITFPYNEDRKFSVGFNESRTFRKNPSWKQQVAKHQNATYPYSRTGGTAVPVQYQGSVDSKYTYYTIWGTWFGSALVDSPDYTTLKDVALGRLKNKLNGHVGQASLAPPLAESREIHSLVREINGWSLQMVKDLMLIKRTRGRSALKHAGKVWLWFGFGVSPLLSDLAKAAMSIRDYMDRQDHSVHVSGTASKTYSSSGLTSYIDINTGVSMTIASYGNHEASCRYTGVVDLKIGAGSNYSMLDHLGLEFGQLPATLWELTPYSWVVDYAATVGPWLDDMFYTLPGTLRYLSYNERYRNEVIHIPTITGTSTYRFSGSTKNGKSNYFSLSRTSLATLPSRQLRIKSVDEVAKYGLTKVLNLASVLAGRLKTPHV